MPLVLKIFLNRRTLDGVVGEMSFDMKGGYRSYRVITASQFFYNPQFLRDGRFTQSLTMLSSRHKSGMRYFCSSIYAFSVRVGETWKMDRLR